MKPIALYWWHKAVPNFGDDCSPWIVSSCFGREVVPGGKYASDLVAVGSVISTVLYKDKADKPWTDAWLRCKTAVNRQFRRPIAVWGSGLMFPLTPGLCRRFYRRPVVFAVRGPKTWDALCALGAVDPAVSDRPAFGDPGIFMDGMLASGVERIHRRGLVLHASYWNNGKAAAFAAEHPEIHLIDPRRHAVEVVSDIASCREVFSCSLHGLIAADALGLPNRWVELEISASDAAGSRFKFDDYYAAFGEHRDPCRLRDVTSLSPLDPVRPDAIASVRIGLRQAAERACAYLEGRGRP